MHLRHVLAGHRLNDKPPVVGGEEAGPAAALAVAVHRGASCHRVLRETEEKRGEEERQELPPPLEKQEEQSQKAGEVRVTRTSSTAWLWKKIQPRDMMLHLCSRGRVPAQLPSTHTNEL